MESGSALRPGFGPLVVVSLLIGLLAIPLIDSPGAGASSSDQVRRCRKVLVTFEPEGGGGAVAIRTRNTRCFRARKIVRRCIKGKLTRRWKGRYSRNRFLLRNGRRRISYVPVGGGGCIPVRARRARPSADRLEVFRVNLDRDRRKEKVRVYDRFSGQSPVTWFEVLDRLGTRWILRQKVKVNESAGAPSSGLREAWVGDLNRDGRVEIAIRDAITPSVGEILSVFRQIRGQRRFYRLQVVGGDRVRVKRRSRRTALVTVSRTSGHSPDGREHSERWKWSARKGRWLCRTDCARF